MTRTPHLVDELHVLRPVLIALASALPTITDHQDHVKEKKFLVYFEFSSSTVPPSALAAARYTQLVIANETASDTHLDRDAHFGLLLSLFLSLSLFF